MVNLVTRSIGERSVQIDFGDKPTAARDRRSVKELVETMLSGLRPRDA